MSEVNVISLGKQWRVAPSANFSSSLQEKHPWSSATNLPLLWSRFHWFYDLHRAGCKVHFVKYAQTIKTRERNFAWRCTTFLQMRGKKENFHRPPQLTVNGGFRIKRGRTPQSVLQCNSYTSNHKYNEKGGVKWGEGRWQKWCGAQKSSVRLTGLKWNNSAVSSPPGPLTSPFAV